MNALACRIQALRILTFRQNLVPNLISAGRPAMFVLSEAETRAGYIHKLENRSRGARSPLLRE